MAPGAIALGLDRIGTSNEHDWDGCRRGFDQIRRVRAFGCGNQAHPTADQVGDQLREPIIVILAPAVFDDYVATLDVASLAQPPPKCRDEIGARLRRTRVEISDHRQRRLLRTCRHRPSRCRAAEQRNEFAPSHERPPARAQPTISSKRGCVVRHSKFGAPTADVGQER